MFYLYILKPISSQGFVKTQTIDINLIYAIVNYYQVKAIW